MRVRQIGFLLGILSLFTPALLHAAAVGSIVGSVVDSQTGAPLPSVNIVVEGSLYGASTDAEGNYIITKLPPAIYSLRASMIGYKNQVVSDVRVQVNRQTKVDFQLLETFIEMDPVVVVAGKTQQRLDEANVSISVVTARDIERRNAIDIKEALETAPGVNFIGDQINIRGSTGYTFGAGNKVLLLLDGVPVYASDTGQFNWDMLPPMDIEQIEILKGAGSTLWGASALGGVVNIMTKDPTEQGRFMYSFSGGKYDKPYYQEWEWTDHSRLWYNRADMSYSRRIGNLGMRLSGGRYETTGYQQLGDAIKYNLTGKFDYRWNNGIKWTGYAAYSYIDKGFFVQWKGQNDPYEVDEANLDNYAQTNQLNAYMKLAVPISSTFGFNVRGSFIRTLMGNQFGSSADFNPAIGQGLEVQADWLPHSAHVVTFGTQYQLDAGSTKFFGDHKGSFIGPYLQDEWKIRKNIRLTTGLRYDRYQLHGGKAEDLWSPRIGLNWQPWSTTSFRASAGSGFRAATIIERFLELTIMNFKIKANPDLKAETSWAYDLGWRQYINENWNFDIAVFRNIYENLIEAHLDLIRGQIQFRNIADAYVEGIEVTTNWNYPARIGGIDVTPGLTLSGTFMDHEDQKYHESLTYRPKTLLTGKASLKISNFQIQADYRYASKIDEVKIYPINDRVAMNFFDLRLFYDFGLFTLQLGVNNMLQYNYAPMESNLMPPRTYTLGLKGQI
ncbi:hypothetical protein EH223_19795 [candidate division KSB1 bacterium]|nr:TonB-dependent receptor [candidate division KSB1 bacterium]RQW00187.1 MAG: hypothetical protein EH223_19795 [candidate division KSB1 bacterium]